MNPLTQQPVDEEIGETKRMWMELGITIAVMGFLSVITVNATAAYWNLS